MKFYWYLDHHPWIEMCRTATHFVVQYSSSVFPLLCGCFNLQYIPQDKHVFYRYFSMTWLTWLSFFSGQLQQRHYDILYYMQCMYDICIQYICMIYVYNGMYDICIYDILYYHDLHTILLHLSSLLQAAARRQQTSICTEREILTDVARKLNQVIHPDPKRDVYRSCRWCMMMLEYVGWDVIQWPID